MADVKVIAVQPGQKPDGDWAFPGDTFDVDDALVSVRWMKRADGKPWSKAKQAEAAPPSSEQVTSLTEKLEQSQKDLAKAQADAALLAQRDRDLEAAQKDLAELKDQLATAQAKADEADAQRARADDLEKQLEAATKTADDPLTPRSRKAT